MFSRSSKLESFKFMKTILKTKGLMCILIMLGHTRNNTSSYHASMTIMGSLRKWACYEKFKMSSKRTDTNNA